MLWSAWAAPGNPRSGGVKHVAGMRCVNHRTECWFRLITGWSTKLIKAPERASRETGLASPLKLTKASATPASAVGVLLPVLAEAREDTGAAEQPEWTWPCRARQGLAWVLMLVDLGGLRDSPRTLPGAG